MADEFPDVPEPEDWNKVWPNPEEGGDGRRPLGREEDDRLIDGGIGF